MNLPGSAEWDQAFAAIQKEAVRRRSVVQEKSAPRIHIGMATCGIASGALETRTAFLDALGEEGIEAGLHSVGCMGHCYAEPTVVIEKPGFPPILYHNVTPGKARMLVKSYLLGGDPLLEHLLGATEENELIPSVMNFPRFSREKRVVTEKCGRIDPEGIFEYIAEGGYGELVRSLSLDPAEVIRMIQESGLRGRGGAGFYTGAKWALAGEAAGREKAVICNADEGDPGAYMDRTILESNPHQVLEGMAICAYAIGAHRATIYIRAEYPLAVNILRKAITQAEELGLLGGTSSGADLIWR
jgi:NADH-quinone oxidoreductase subunit F